MNLTVRSRPWLLSLFWSFLFFFCFFFSVPGLNLKANAVGRISALAIRTSTGGGAERFVRVDDTLALLVENCSGRGKVEAVAGPSLKNALNGSGVEERSLLAGGRIVGFPFALLGKCSSSGLGGHSKTHLVIILSTSRSVSVDGNNSLAVTNGAMTAVVRFSIDIVKRSRLVLWDCKCERLEILLLRKVVAFLSGESSRNI